MTDPIDALLRPPPIRGVVDRVSTWWSDVGVTVRLLCATGAVGIAVVVWWMWPTPTINVELPRAVAGNVGATVTAAGQASAGETTAPASSPPGASGNSTTTASVIVVDVGGAVVRPGVLTLPVNSRVNDAVIAAGGLATEAVTRDINLAALLADGDRVYVPVQGEPAPAPSARVTPSTRSPRPGTKINLNTASQADLEELPGVGPSTAQAIVAFRAEHGRFGSVNDLEQVRGIGPARFETLSALVTV